AERGLFVLFAGRHVEYKGVDVLLRALAGSTAHAVIAGGGPQRGAWETLARDLRLDGRVTVTGGPPDAELPRPVRAWPAPGRSGAGAAVDRPGGGVRLRAARSDGGGPPGDQHRRAERRVVGEPGRPHGVRRPGGGRAGARLGDRSRDRRRRAGGTAGRGGPRPH